MKNGKFDSLSNHIKKKDVIKIISRFNNEESSLTGVPLQSSENFILIQIIMEFFFNGYAIIPKQYIEKIRCNKFDKTLKKILTAEKIIEKQLGIEHKIDLSDWQNIFGELKQLDYHVILECEDLHEPIFTIGPIKRIDNKNVKIQFYDASGLLEIKNTSIQFKDITSVTFGDRYSTIFRKHLKTKKK